MFIIFCRTPLYSKNGNNDLFFRNAVGGVPYIRFILIVNCGRRYAAPTLITSD